MLLAKSPWTKAKVFAGATLSYLATLFFGLIYAYWCGASFFPALKLVQLNFATVLLDGDTSRYPAFFKDATQAWPHLLAIYPASSSDLFKVLMAFMLVIASFRILQKKPTGEPLDEQNLPSPVACRLIQARKISGFYGTLRERDDGGRQAHGVKGTVYLPHSARLLLDRRLDGNAAERFAFLLQHELAHSRSLDNWLVSISSGITALLIGYTSMLLPQFVLYAANIMLPNWLFRTDYSEYFAFGISGVLTLLALALIALALAG